MQSMAVWRFNNTDLKQVTKVLKIKYYKVSNL